MDNIFDTKYQLKMTIRNLIYTSNPVLRQNLLTGTQILHSKQYPTQVFKLKDTKYIRVNSNDIERLDEQELEDLLKFMLSINDYSTQETEEPSTTDEPKLEDILTEAANKYQEETGEDLTDTTLIEKDEFNNISKTDNVPIKLKKFKLQNEEENSNDEEDVESEENDNMTEELKQTATDTGLVEDSIDQQLQKQNTEVTDLKEEKEIEQTLEEVETYNKSNPFNNGTSILNSEEIKALNHMTHQLLKAFKGHRSKEKTITPKKHINAKSLATDNDRFYVNKKAPKGKHITFNLLIDMSGSMDGTPMKNAVSLIYLFNRLARLGYVTGHVIYSATGKHHVAPLGISDAEVLGNGKTYGAEGLADTIDKEVDILKNKNLICITDGDIVDRPIDKNFWRKHKIVATGVYVNKQLKDPLEYSGILDNWFDHSLVRKDLEELIQLLIKIGIKG